MTHATKSATLKVPGARIHYEMRGAGPLLLIIPGGPQDAGVFADVARHLADRYTVVAYDPRGNSRSTFDGAPGELVLDVHGDDAAALIQALGGGPAYVFGTSGGAHIGLNLAARHPGAGSRAGGARTPEHDAAARPLEGGGRRPGPARHLSSRGRRRRDGEVLRRQRPGGRSRSTRHRRSSPRPPRRPRRLPGSAATSSTGSPTASCRCRSTAPTSMRCARAKPRVVVGIGEESAGQPIDSMGMALADKLGTERVPFPGDHMGFEPHADTFAATLHRALGSSRQMTPGSRTLAGSCLCGAVHYAVADEFVYAANCHCSNCRRATGSAFKPFAGIERDKLRVIKGEDDLMISSDRKLRRHTLQGVRLVSLFGGPRRRLCSRHHGNSRRRSNHPSEQAHLRRLEGAVVRNHRRPAAIRNACEGHVIPTAPG